jgi:nucleoside 2-deoxyribosyltransferase
MQPDWKGPCPICKLDGQIVRGIDFEYRSAVKCRRCGSFSITSVAVATASRQNLQPLSAWIRDRAEHGVEIPELTPSILKEIMSSLPDYRVAEKQSLLMKAFDRRTEYPGQSVPIVLADDYPLAWASGEEELRYLIRSLIERGYVRRTDELEDLPDREVPEFQIEITAVGWDFLDESAGHPIVSDQVFVAMSFAPELRSAWEVGIRPALLNAQYRPYRIDSEPHIERIDSKIIAEIKNSRFVVADVTNQRPGVYFEAGFALGLGLPVFWSVREDDLRNVHFDTRQYNHIVWKDETDLADQLLLFITAVVGKGGVT